MDCGPSCLRMVAKYYGRAISLETLREKSQIGKEGVNLLGISEAAETIGFRTQSVKLRYETLVKEAKLPPFCIGTKITLLFCIRSKGRNYTLLTQRKD